MPELIEGQAQRAIEISAICLIAQALAGLEISSGEREPRLVECAGRGRPPARRDPAAGLGLELARPGQVGDQRAVQFEQAERGVVVAALGRTACGRDREHGIDGRAALRSLVARSHLFEPVEQREVALDLDPMAQLGLEREKPLQARTQVRAGELGTHRGNLRVLARALPVRLGFTDLAQQIGRVAACAARPPAQLRRECGVAVRQRRARAREQSNGPGGAP